MATLINLTDLLKHEILDLYSAEEQIIDALPKMIEKANNGNLKKALSDHLRVTEQQKKRLDQVKQLLQDSGENEDLTEGENKGFFSRLFGGGSQKCKGTEGLITEGEKMMGEDMSPEALDAAIIASAQKIEHYEISGYGTARAFARELNLTEVANLLTQTLNEEYQADDQLTQLAVGKLNIDAEYAKGIENGNGHSGKLRSMSKQSSGNGSTSKRSSSNGKSQSTNNKKTTSSTASSKKSKTSQTKSAAGKTKSTTSSRTGSSNKNNTSKRSSGVRSVAVKSASKTSGRSKPSAKKASPVARKSSSNKKATSGRR
jgi:ferritin-like metal-binding protein YciE